MTLPTKVLKLSCFAIPATMKVYLSSLLSGFQLQFAHVAKIKQKGYQFAKMKLCVGKEVFVSDLFFVHVSVPETAEI